MSDDTRPAPSADVVAADAHADQASVRHRDRAEQMQEVIEALKRAVAEKIIGSAQESARRGLELLEPSLESAEAAEHLLRAVEHAWIKIPATCLLPIIEELERLAVPPIKQNIKRSKETS